ncbi:MAG: helix-turn-helix transcriptional regulator [Chloroflexota bacterium]
MPAMKRDLAQLIRNQRIALSLTIRELAKASGASASYLGRIERGERSPSGQTLKKIARPLGFDVNELFTLAGYLPTPSGVAERTPSYFGSRQLDPWVARTLAQEPPEIQRAAVNILILLKNIAKTVAPNQKRPRGN